MTQKHINGRILNSIPKPVKDWMKSHTISDAKLLVRELNELGEDTAELQPLIYQLEEMEDEAREYLGLGEEDIVEFSEPESVKAVA
ncbi:MAG: hypothetical protein N3F63_00145 [Thermoplasmata archaeon]|nr:hypothetical protein [Thermoplasmata archaeon]